ncbi:MAG TPA: hypothetical protein VFG47_07405 [Geminicoccaceae bacterium]|nr:hypothetical protein [Geminicoccaceae bacterium]
MRILTSAAGNPAQRVEAILVRTLALVTLLLATLALFTAAPRYHAVGDDLLRNGTFADGLEGWSATPGVTLEARAPVVILTNPDRGEMVGLQQTLDLPGERPLSLRLSAEVAIERVIPGPERWDTARLLLVPIDAEGHHLWGRPHNLMLVSGTGSWRRYTRVFEMPAGAPRALLAAGLSGASGRMWVRDVGLLEVVERGDFRLVAGGMRVLWVVVLGWVGLGVWRAVEPGPRRLVLAGAALAVAAVALVPDELRTGAIAWALGPLVAGMRNPDAVGRFALFALLAVVARAVRPSDPAWFLLLALGLFAAATEMAQFFLAEPPEADDFVDWLADLAGAGAGLALAGFARRLWRPNPRAVS